MAQLHRVALRHAAVVVPAAAMLVLACWDLGRPSMFGAEADTYWAAQLGLGRLLRLLGHVDAVHGTYYLLVHVLFVAGASPTLMRVPSALAAAAATAMVSILATRLTGSRRVGLVAAVLYLLLPSVNSWAQSGRSYAIVTLAVTVVLLLLLRAAEVGDSRGRWFAFGAATVVAGYLHEMTLLLVPAFAITLLWSRVPRRTLVWWAGSTAVSVVLVAPLILLSARERNAVAHLRHPDLRSLRELLHVYTGPSEPISYALAAAVVIGVVAGLRAAAADGRVGAVRLMLPMLLVPPALLFALSHVSATSLFDTRYVLYGTVATVVLAAIGLDGVGTLVAAATPGNARRLVAALPAVALCAAAAVLLSPSLARLHTPAAHGEDYGGSSRYLAAHARPGDGLVFSTHGARNAELGYPAQYRGLVDVTLGQSPETSATFRGTTATPRVRDARLARLNRVWIVGAYPVPGGPSGLRAILPGLFSQFRRTERARFSGVNDVLFVRDRPAPPAA